MNTEDLKDELINEHIEETIDNQENIDDANNVQSDELTAEERLKIDLANEKDKFLRLFAEFENYKKRTSKERIELFKTANQEVLLAMLPVLDDFERAWQEVLKLKTKILKKACNSYTKNSDIRLNQKAWN